MLIQYLLHHEISTFHGEVCLTLQNLGHQITMIYYPVALDGEKPAPLTQQLSPNAHITLIDEANALPSLVKLPIDDNLLPNLVSLTPSLYSLDSYCAPKPIVMLYGKERSITSLVTAMDMLNRSPVRCLERIGNYDYAHYGWVLRDACDEPYAREAWLRLRKFIWPGHITSTWLYHEKHTRVQFRIISISDSEIAFEPGVEGKYSCISKADFCEVAKGWVAYKSGEIPERTLKYHALLYPHILGLLHQLDLDGRLNNISSR